MTNDSDISQLSPTSAIQSSTQAIAGTWFNYLVTAHAHHTDYAGIVWHGSYIAWMEEARVECLRSIGILFADLVALGCDLPVVELAIRYHQPIRMGTNVNVKTRMVGVSGVRINWDYQIESVESGNVFATARVTLVAVDREKGKIMRQLPATLKNALLTLAEA